MAASANPSPNNNNNNSNHEGLANGNGVTSNGNSVPDNSGTGDATRQALRHDPGVSFDWTADEHALLVELLAQYASESTMIRYAKVAMQLTNKTVRDVALRCRWMNKKENGKRRKEDQNSARKNKDKKEKVSDSVAKPSHVTNRTAGPTYAQAAVSLDNDDGISYLDIGGPTGQLLEQTAITLQQISANFSSFKVHENIGLFCKARDNILTILNDLNDMPEIMKQMPPIPMKLNEELANSMLPPAALLKKS